jgi:hypothetical protein
MVHFRASPAFRISTVALLVAAALAPTAAVSQTQKVNGILAIPVEEDNSVFDADAFGGARVKGNVGRSMGGQIAARLQNAIRSGNLPKQPPTGKGNNQKGEGSGGENAINVQANDPNLDHTVTFTGTRPFEFATQSETSAVMDGNHIVVGYNSSANTVVERFGAALFYSKVMLSGFSTSHDGGKTWASGFVPPVSDDAPFTFGDPALAIDRSGNIYYASLGADAAGNSSINVNKSADHGTTFGAAKVVALDEGSDKEWLAIGPDPVLRSRDNIYVTWTSFITNAAGRTIRSELWFARSVDGGQTFIPRLLFAPVDDGINSSFASFTNPVVDASTGRLYVPFEHFSNVDADNVRVLVSDDGGLTFRFLAFNVPGAVDANAYPNVTPGEVIDCNNGGIRLALTAGPDQGDGRFGLRRPRQATRLITQPHAAARNGAFVFVLNTNVSPFFGDSSAGSEINAIYSKNGGVTWNAPVRVAVATAADPQHVHPALSLSGDGAKLSVSYYVQQSDQRLRTDVAHFAVNNNGLKLNARSALSSATFELTPSNIARSRTTTTNFDRLIQTCYDIGEYQALARSRGDSDDNMIAAWGDNRQTWVGPAGSPAPGPHPQPDVFTVRVQGQ